MKAKLTGRKERLMCCMCHVKRKASNRSYCKACWAERAKARRAVARQAFARGHGPPPAAKR